MTQQIINADEVSGIRFMHLVPSDDLTGKRTVAPLPTFPRLLTRPSVQGCGFPSLERSLKEGSKSPVVVPSLRY